MSVQTEQAFATELRVGDRITETATPGGPFYPVLTVEPRAFTIDAGYDGDPLPVTLPRSGAVLRIVRHCDHCKGDPITASKYAGLTWAICATCEPVCE